MKYESEFRIKEKEFRPRENYSHQKVVDELANIVKRADLEIDELNKACYNGSNELDRLKSKLEDETREKITFGVLMVLSFTMNILLVQFL